MLWCRERTRLASHQHPLFVSDLYSAPPWRPMLTSRRLVRWNESTGGTIPRMNRNGMNQYAREIILQIHISSLWIEREGTKCASFFAQNDAADRICVSAINLGALGAAQERDAVRLGEPCLNINLIWYGRCQNCLLQGQNWQHFQILMQCPTCGSYSWPAIGRHIGTCPGTYSSEVVDMV